MSKSWVILSSNISCVVLLGQRRNYPAKGSPIITHSSLVGIVSNVTNISYFGNYEEFLVNGTTHHK